MFIIPIYFLSINSFNYSLRIPQLRIATQIEILSIKRRIRKIPPTSYIGPFRRQFPRKDSSEKSFIATDREMINETPRVCICTRWQPIFASRYSVASITLVCSSDNGLSSQKCSPSISIFKGVVGIFLQGFRCTRGSHSRGNWVAAAFPSFLGSTKRTKLCQNESHATHFSICFLRHQLRHITWDHNFNLATTLINSQHHISHLHATDQL